MDSLDSSVLSIVRHALGLLRRRPLALLGASALFHLPLIVYAVMVVVGVVEWRFATGFALTLATDLLMVSVFAAIVQRAQHARIDGLAFDLGRAMRELLPRSPQIALIAVLRVVRCLVWLFVPFAGPGFILYAYARTSMVGPACAIEGLGPSQVFERAKDLATAPSVPLVRLVMTVGALPLALQLILEILAHGGNVPMDLPRITSVAIAILVAPISASAFGFAFEHLRGDTYGDSGVARAFE